MGDYDTIQGFILSIERIGYAEFGGLRDLTRNLFGDGGMDQSEKFPEMEFSILTLRRTLG